LSRAAESSPPLLAISVLSAGTLAYEVLLMRLFSIIQWHHFAYMIISVALLGYGVGGALVAVAQDALKPRFSAVFVTAAALFGITALGNFLLAQQVAFNPLELLWDPEQPLRLVLIYLLLMVPFACAATGISLTFARFADQPHRIYSFDIVGAGAGSLGIVASLFVLTPLAALTLVTSLALVAAGIAAFTLTPLPKWVLVAFLIAAVVLPLSFPSDWVRLRPSDYKDLSQTLRIKGTRLLAQRPSPIGLVTAVASPLVPFRDAPGLSLNAPEEPPPQIGLFTDGNGPSALTHYDGKRERLRYLDYLTNSLPYHLLEKPRVLVLGAGAGQDVLQAIYHGATRIDAVELHPQIIDLVQKQFGEFSGKPYSAPSVRIHVAEARGFVASQDDRYDLIQVALVDAFGTSSAGLHGLAESYLYTIEALQEYVRHLRPGGLLAITRWITLPPRDVLKMFETARQALEKSGVREPDRRLALIRSWRTATLLVKTSEFDAAEIANLKQFCQSRSFDVAYYPGIRPSEANRFNLLERPYLFEDLQALLGRQRDAFIERYKFSLRPATDDQPYFFHFFKWRTLPELVSLKERGGLPLLEWGYPVLVATLAQALVVSPLLVLVPLCVTRGRLRDPGIPRRFHARIVVYFTGIALAFMFLEIVFIQKFILFLSHPVYAVAVSLSAILFFAGLGSHYSQRVKRGANHRAAHPVMRPVVVICLVTSLYLIALPSLFQQLMALNFAVKTLLCVALLAPLTFCMGMPFPLGVSSVAACSEPLVPWAWGINACASVVGAILATLLAIHFGFTAVVVLALLLYALAAATYPGTAVRHLTA
jgi:spermidine synthase